MVSRRHSLSSRAYFVAWTWRHETDGHNIDAVQWYPLDGLGSPSFEICHPHGSQRSSTLHTIRAAKKGCLDNCTSESPNGSSGLARLSICGAFNHPYRRRLSIYLYHKAIQDQPGSSFVNHLNRIMSDSNRNRPVDCHIRVAIEEWPPRFRRKR